MRREVESLRPPIFQNTRCLAAIMGKTGDSGHNSRLDRPAKNATSPANLAVILNYPPRFEIRADNRRFRATRIERRGCRNWGFRLGYNQCQSYRVSREVFLPTYASLFVTATDLLWVSP